MARCFPTLLFMALLATSRAETSDGGESKKPPESLQKLVQVTELSNNLAKEPKEPAESVVQKSTRGSTLSIDNAAKESVKPAAGIIINSVQRSAMSSDNSMKESAQQSKLGPRSTADDIGENIVREEAPLIRDIEQKMREGRETERNLTATRDVIRHEMDSAGGTGAAEGGDGKEMEERLRELDGYIGQLHSKNKLAEEKFRKFIGSIDSGKIKDEQQAHSRLEGISRFVDTDVMGSVKGSKSAFRGVVNVYRRVKGGIRRIFHSLLGLRQPQMKAGVNLLAGI